MAYKLTASAHVLPRRNREMSLVTIQEAGGLEVVRHRLSHQEMRAAGWSTAKDDEDRFHALEQASRSVAESLGFVYPSEYFDTLEWTPEKLAGHIVQVTAYVTHVTRADPSAQ